MGPRQSAERRLQHKRFMVRIPVFLHPAAQRQTQWVEGVRDFADAYDLWLLDQWGVLHDGQKTFPGVVACLRRLKALDKRIVVLSNSGKRVDVNAARLQAMGIGPELYTAMITSGELARLKLAAREAPFDRLPGRRCLLLSSNRDHSVTDGLDIHRVPTVGEADFILLSGVDDALPRTFYQAVFELGCARRLPLICANPDLVRFTERGMMPSAGEFARLYEDLGGTVHYIGKPYPEIYRFCLERYGFGNRERTIAVGDSLYHDVCGGVRAGLAAAFVIAGIHQHEFAELSTDAERREHLKAVARDCGAAPDWAIPQLRW